MTRVAERDNIEYDSMGEAVRTWAREHKPMCRDRERGVFIFVKTDRLTRKKTYVTGRTFKGTRNNVIPGFIVGYLYGFISGLFPGRGKPACFAHTHPEPGTDKHNDFPSKADLFLLKLPMINEVYIVPWKRCPGVPDIISASDRHSWEH